MLRKPPCVFELHSFHSVSMGHKIDIYPRRVKRLHFLKNFTVIKSAALGKQIRSYFCLQSCTVLKQL